LPDDGGVPLASEADSQEALDMLSGEPTIAMMSVSSSASSVLLNYDETFDLYAVPSSSTFMSTLADLDEALSFMASTSSVRVNALLDSGSTHHIFQDQSLFSNHDTAGATSVSTANCGSLAALGSGDVAI